MKLTRHELKNIMAQSIQPKGDCLSDDLLISFNEGDVNPQERERIIEHFKTCKECTNLWKSYNIFMNKAVKKVPEKFKKKAYQKAAKPQTGTIIRFFSSPYIAYAAIVLLAVSIVFIVYTQLLLKQTNETLTFQNQRLEELRDNQMMSQQQLADLKKDLDARERDFLQSQVPVAGVPLYDLFPEGIYQREAAPHRMLTIKGKGDKPVYLILNITEAVKNSCTVRLLDDEQEIIWHTTVPSIKEGTLTLLVPPNMGAAGKYRIEVRDASSKKLYAAYRFAIEK